MEGIINVLKPPGMTSSDVVVWLRKILQTKKIGHTGTLDEGAAGVLPICVGKGTRLAEFITEQGKAYLAEVTFGIATDTQDAFGNVVCQTTPDLKQQDVERVIPKFLGKLKQTPPMYSAVRKEGKHLYEYARQGIAVERPPREVFIYNLKMVKWYYEAGAYPKAMLAIDCSKGTYIRTICHDLGQALGCGAHMSYLLRIRSGLFKIKESWTLEEIEEAVRQSSYDFLLPLTVGIDLPQVFLSAGRAAAFRCGLPTKREFVRFPAEGLLTEGDLCSKKESRLPEGNKDGQKPVYVQVLEGGALLGIGVWREEGLFPHKVLS